MQLRAFFWWDRLRTSFWFIPAVMAIGAVAFAFATVAIDHRIGSDRLEGVGWLYGGGPEGARAVLSVIASSMITVAGVVFSIMMVVLSLAAQQFGPRLLRNFMRDRITQSVLGVFVATFLYCLMVLRTVRGTDHDQFVPHISVTAGVLLALTGLSVLIYFIHHVSVSIHVGEIISRVQGELLSVIDSMFPENLGEDEREMDDEDINSRLPPDFEGEATPVWAESAGYLEAIEDKDLLDAAKRSDLIVRLEVRPGDFILPRQSLMRAWPAHRLDEDTIEKLRDSMMMGRQRTPVQDIEFALEQQADIAIRALSPGINDPFTAMNCLDHLGEALVRLAERRFPSVLRYDDEGELRVIAAGFSFRRMVEASLGRVREYGRGSATVTIKILEVLTRLAGRIRRDADRQALLDELDAIAADQCEAFSPHDLARVRGCQEQARRQLERAAAPGPTFLVGVNRTRR